MTETAQAVCIATTCGEAGPAPCPEYSFMYLRRPTLLAISLSAAAFPIHCHAQSRDITKVPDVLVTATREATPVNQAIADVTVIGPEELRRNPARNLTELLGQQAGIEITMSGGLGSTSSAFIRGSNSNHVLLLVDGMRTGSATAGIPSLENIPLGQIERIEIVRGPLSSLYGSDALGGVIQVFTRTGQGSGSSFIPNAQLTLGSQGFRQLGVGFAGRQDALDYSLQLQNTRTDGFSVTNANAPGFPPFGTYHPDRDGFDQTSFSANLGYKFNADWKLRLTATDSRGRTAFDEGYDPLNPGQSGRGKIQTQVLGLALEGRLSGQWTSKLSLSQSSDVSEVTGALNNYMLSRFKTRQNQLSWTHSLASGFGNWSLGLERLQQTVSLSDAFATPNFNPDQRTIDSVWLGWNLQRGAWQWQSSLRHDRNSQFGSKASGNVGMAYRINEAWRVQASVATGFAAPSFNNLYFPFFGNPALKPEQSLSREIGLRWAVKGSDLKLVYFNQTIRDLIVVDPTMFTPVNLDRANIQGLSAQLRHRSGPWTVNASLDLSQPVNDASGAQHGNLLPRRSRQNLKLSLDHDFGLWQAGGSLRATGRRFDDAANNTALGGYGLIDLRALYPIDKTWSVGLNLNNLSNKFYETAYGFNQPGRQVFLTLNYRPGM